MISHACNQEVMPGVQGVLAIEWLWNQSGIYDILSQKENGDFRTGMLAQVCNVNTGEVEAGRSRVYGQTHLCSEFEAGLVSK